MSRHAAAAWKLLSTDITFVGLLVHVHGAQVDHQRVLPRESLVEKKICQLWIIYTMQHYLNDENMLQRRKNGQLSAQYYINLTCTNAKQRRCSDKLFIFYLNMYIYIYIYCVTHFM